MIVFRPRLPTLNDLDPAGVLKELDRLGRSD